MDPSGSTETENGDDRANSDSDSTFPGKRKSDKHVAKTDTKTQTSEEETDENEKSVLECPVCLQPCQFPVQLPCNHIFCFLCVKGVVSRNKGCALCRQPIPSTYLCRPNLLHQEMLMQTLTFDDGFSWFYEGTDGWWQYDGRTSTELEMHHKAGHSSCELLIAGHVYIIDLSHMVQFRRHDRTRKRRVKRDLAGIQGRKGIAGLRITTENASATNDRTGADGRETTSNSTSGQQWIPTRHTSRPSGDNSTSPRTPHNTPQTPMTPSESPLANGHTDCDLSGPLRRLGLSDDNTPERSQDTSSGSGRNFNSSDSTNPSVEDIISASLQHLQSETDGHDFTDVTEDGEDTSDRGC